MFKKKCFFAVLSVAFIMSLSTLKAQTSDANDEFLKFSDGSLTGWTADSEGTWIVSKASEIMGPNIENDVFVLNSYKAGGEKMTGKITSIPFTVTHDSQKFLIAGADGTAANSNDGSNNYILLRSHPDGKILRKMRPPGTNMLIPSTWDTWDLIGKSVYIELVDNNPQYNPIGYAWIAIADYHQTDSGLGDNLILNDNLYALNIDENSNPTRCKTIPFLTASPESRGQTTRKYYPDAAFPQTETIPVNAKAKTIYLLGMMNRGWDMGVAHWGDHAQLMEKRDEELFIGKDIGTIEIIYENTTSDTIPLTMGATCWFVNFWSDYPEPFASRPDFKKQWNKYFLLSEDESKNGAIFPHLRFFLAIEPRNKKIRDIVIHDDTDTRGFPLISAITLADPQGNPDLYHFGEIRVDESDLKPALKSYKKTNFTKNLNALKAILYTSENDLPKKVSPINFPENIDATIIRFQGPVHADMLNNLWIANLTEIAQKFDPNTGFFGESAKDAPSYGEYYGIGTWRCRGQYAPWAFSRCSDHYASLALRNINNNKRLQSFIDYCDKFLYFYRADHDPNNGPPNPTLDISQYPKDAPPHWSFVVNESVTSKELQLNEMAGNQEMDGHGVTVVARWMAWRMLGQPTGDWLTDKRSDIFNKSRWDSTVDSTEMICWLMDYTQMDLIYSEGETTHWGEQRLPPYEWVNETDPDKIRKNYANANMYENYPTYVCLIALKCSAQIADAMNDAEKANKWRAYADKLQSAMVRMLTTGDRHNQMWDMGPTSVYPNQMECLAPAWFAFYYEGLDTQKLNPDNLRISTNTLHRQLNLKSGYTPVAGFGYGIGWLTKSALILDHMDDAGKLLVNIAKYSYDKNMNYVNEENNIDWTKWLWIVPEGTHLMPDGSWHRIGDLGNGANQGITLHALEMCAGVDDTKPENLKIVPRVPDPFTGLNVENLFALVPADNGLTKARINYSFDRQNTRFELTSDITLPNLAVRIGPFDHKSANDFIQNADINVTCKARVERSGKFKNAPAYWIWFENIKNTNNVNISK